MYYRINSAILLIPDPRETHFPETYQGRGNKEQKFSCLGDLLGNPGDDSTRKGKESSKSRKKLERDRERERKRKCDEGYRR
mmetsp:Transcript_5743/g.6389  ORF Transcript_5743/g.6389 Transcript_5743/m.6389 type:complete len:81 (+) Transcript_5743:242-484(+)